MKLELKNVNAKAGNFELKNISFEAQTGSFFSIVGPTGSGKSTLLKAIAGIAAIDKGEVFLGEDKITNMPPEKRGVGFVFQDSALFPHLNVFENVAFGLRVRKEKNVEEKVKETLGLTGLKGFEKRNVQNLSGGEKKLVAIARAIAFAPKLLLLDEPLAGLDARLREKLKRQIKELQESLGVTTLYVTHDIDEAFFLSDKIMVLNNGKIEQVGAPKEIFLSPKTAFVKEFVSDYSLVKARVEKKGGKKVLSARLEAETSQEEGNGFVNVKKNNFRKEN